MGIPGLFYRLVKKYGNVLIKYSLPKIGNISNSSKINLYFDYNGIIHTAGRLAKSNKYEDIYKSIGDYTKTLINIIKPTGIIYIAIDGVAPMAKIKQQRMRRFKQIDEENIANFNMVSPGTLFMKNLSIYLKKEFPNVMISDDSEPSEGEHKIMKHIKKENNNNINVIYGMDADLIILALSLFKENIWIFREDSFVFGKTKNVLNLNDPRMIYLDIYSLRTKIIEELKCNLMDVYNTSNISDNRYIIDYIFMSFFVGNDFLPAFEAIKIKTGGIETLINTYTMLDDFLINEDLSINYESLIEFLTILESKEVNLLVYNKYILDKSKSNLDGSKLDESMNLDLINVKSYGWINRYYDYFFYNSITLNNNEKADINKFCIEYLKGLTWNIKYYFEECNDWLWYYPYYGNVLITDLLLFLKTNANANENGNANANEKYEFAFNLDSKPISHVDQLLMILPMHNLNLIDTDIDKSTSIDTDISTDISNTNIKHFIKNLLNNKEIMEKYYPEKFKLLTYGKMYYHEYIPIIPCVNLELINNWKSKLS
jgi:5'-3' exonuclease